MSYAINAYGSKALNFPFCFALLDSVFKICSLPYWSRYPRPGDPLAPLNSRQQLGDRLFKVSHYAPLGRKHREADARSYASAAQVEL